MAPVDPDMISKVDLFLGNLFQPFCENSSYIQYTPLYLSRLRYVYDVLFLLSRVEGMKPSRPQEQAIEIVLAYPVCVESEKFHKMWIVTFMVKLNQKEKVALCVLDGIWPERGRTTNLSKSVLPQPTKEPRDLLSLIINCI